MQLRNKNTGEIGFLRVKLGGVFDGVEKFEVELASDEKMRFPYSSLAELNKSWEDYEEPHETCRLTSYGEVVRFSRDDISNAQKRECVNIGNHFSTEEEAEKAVEKLKAWKRLKDKGFRFTGWAAGCKKIGFTIESLDSKDYMPRFLDKEMTDDLNLLFGGEE